MPEDREREDDERLPDLPPVPELPHPPKLKPNLPPLPRDAERDEPGEYGKLGLAYTIPAALAAPVVVLTLAGWWLDGRFGKSPYFTLGGALLGMVTGLMNMLRIANRLNK